MSRALVWAVLRSYRNGLVGAYRKNPPLGVLVVLVACALYLLVTVVQLQSVLPTIASPTLTQLSAGQLADVARASLMGVGALSWGVTQVLLIAGTQPVALRLLALTKGVRRTSMTAGLVAPDLGGSALAGLLVMGPVALASTYRALVVGGHPGWQALAQAAVLTVLVAVVASTTVLGIDAVVRWLSQRPSGTGAQMAAQAVSATLLVLAVGRVLAGHAGGLAILAPPFAMWSGLTGSTLSVVGGCAVYVLAVGVVISLVPLRLGVAPSGSRVGYRARRVDPLAGSVAKQLVRDRVAGSSIALGVLAVVVIGVMRLTGTLEDRQTSLLLVVAVGFGALTPSVVVFRTAASGWLLIVHPRAYQRWYRVAVLVSVPLMALFAVLAVALGGSQDVVDRAAFLLGTAVAAAAAGLLAGVLVCGLQVHEDDRGALLGSGVVSIVLLLVAMVVALKVPWLGESGARTGAFLVAAGALMVLLGGRVVEARVRRVAA